jgi:DNA topoisomerase-1
MVIYCDIKELEAEKRIGKWWEKMENKKTQKWETLYHNGVYFPPLYEPLPKTVKLYKNGKPVLLSLSTDNEFNISAEECAVFFALKLEQDDRLAEKNSSRSKSSDDETFVKNFFSDWKKILGKNHEITSMKGLDFSKIQQFLVKRSDEKKQNRKSLTKEQKQEEKNEKEKIKNLYGYAVVDGIKIPLGNYTIQPPGLYIGHGNQPLRGKIKRRIKPSDVVLNVSLNRTPKCFVDNKSCSWGEVVENHDVTWIASWKHPITDHDNYVFLKREESHFVCANDIEKFEKARSLKKNIKKVRSQYEKDLKDLKNPEKMQLATAVYLLDIIAVRPGTEKDETKESDTLGLTTLKCENIEFKGNNTIKIDFTGKSSIQFTKNIKVSDIVYKNLSSLCSGVKNKKSQIFKDVNANSLNEYLKTLLPSLTAKVFRTYKACTTLQEELDKQAQELKESSVEEKKLFFDRANIEVAKKLNHKNMTISPEKADKIKEKIKELKKKKKNAKTEKQKQSAEKSIQTQQSKLEQAEGNISLSTSKVNYIDSRIVVSWSKKNDFPIEKIYNKNQLKKFVWSMNTESTWKF